MADIVTFGEAMVRLSPPNFRRLEQTSTLDVNIGGAELNVAVGCARLGLESAWVSKLPENPLGRMIRNKARELGVSVDYLQWDEDGRVGLYFLELGATPRPSSVWYDRAGSSFSTVQPGEFNWEKILTGARCFHITGISPAVSSSASEATLEAIQQAKSAGCKVSLDLNYRTKLWTPQAASKALSPMLKYVDVLITTKGDIATVLGIDAPDDKALACLLLDRYELEVVAVSFREGTSTWRHRWSGIAAAAGNVCTTQTFDVDIVDQVGRGDSFAAGFLYGYLTDGDVQRSLEYGTAFAALKHSFPGDFNWCTREEVDALLAGLRPGVIR